MYYKQQVQQLDCGVAIIQTLHKYFYDKWLSLNLLKSNANYNKEGINIFELSNLANKFGIELEALKGDFKSFSNLKINKPVITIIQNSDYFHYVLVLKINNTQITYLDPLSGRIRISLNDFFKKYMGVIITCKKSKQASKYEKTKINLFKTEFLREILVSSFVSIFALAITYIGTFYLRIIIDQIIPNYLKKELIYISFIFFLFNTTKGILNLLNNYLIHQIEIKIKVDLVQQYIAKLKWVDWLKIHHYSEPIHWKNMEFIESVSNFKAKYLFNCITQGLSIIVFGIILISMDINVFMITILLCAISIWITFMFKNKIKQQESFNIKNSTKLKENFLNIINSIEQFKMSNLSLFLSSKLDTSINNNVQIQNKIIITNFLYTAFQSIIKIGTPILMTYLIINNIWMQNLSIGQMLFFMSIFSFFINPLETLTLSLMEIPIIKQHLDNLEAFYSLSEEEINVNGNKIDEIKKIKLENAQFSYSPTKTLLNIVSLEVDNKHYISGKTGTGKTTLLKIFSTLIKTNGNLVFNDKLIEYYNLDNLRNHIYYLSTNNFLPNITIYEYLSNKDEQATKIFIENYEKYNLNYILKLSNLTLHYKIQNNGLNLSSGQKQLIHILKIFSHNYSLILLDEIFENLDQQILKVITPILQAHLKNKIVIEVSHNNKYLFKGKEINIEHI